MEDKVQSPMDLFVETLLADVRTKVEQKVEGRLNEIDKIVTDKYLQIQSTMGAVDNYIDSITKDKPLVVTLPTPDKKGKKELVHSQFKKVLKVLTSARRKEKNIMLVGEAGSGKTHLCSSIAKALGLEFYPMSVGIQTTKSDLLGFVNAQGNYVTTPVREAYEKGGVLLLDEFDAAHAGVVTILNSLLANGHCSFADKIITKHPNFVCICACNTYGKGATVDYIGRNRLDAATLDRFIVIDVGYDTKLEAALTGNKEWVGIVNNIRSNIKKEGIKMIVSPRATMDGADLLDSGFAVKDVLDMVIFKGVAKDVQAKVLKNIDLTLKDTEIKKGIESSVSTEVPTLSIKFSQAQRDDDIVVKGTIVCGDNPHGSIIINTKGQPADYPDGIYPLNKFSWGSSFDIGFAKGDGVPGVITSARTLFPWENFELTLPSGAKGDLLHFMRSINKYKNTLTPLDGGVDENFHGFKVVFDFDFPDREQLKVILQYQQD